MNHLGLFSGIGGFEEAFRRASASLIAACEIDPQAQRVLKRHFPGTRIINDVKAIEKDTFGGSPIDLITGGFPCQDLSVAGRRKGLDGERSGLWFEYLRIIADHKPRVVVIENVPGLLSSNGGEDFAVILRGLVELGYGVAWRVFDSQFDGVAQRRERVFIVASLGDASCAEILFEREGGAWDSPPSREAGKDIAGTLAAGAHPSGFNGQDAYNGKLIAAPQVAGPLRASGPGSSRVGDSRGRDTLIAFGGNNTSGPIDVATACNAHGGTGRHDFESETFLVAPTLRSSGDNHSGYTTGDGLIIQPQISHALTSEGADASEDGTGRGTPIVVAARMVAPSLTSSYGKQPDSSDTELGPNLVMAFTQNTRDEVRYINGDGELVGALPAERGTKQQSYLSGQFGVRRLTPRECERLQGFPDSWTRYGEDGKEISDSARYRMLGNAVCLPTVEWIARRIMQEDKS